MENFLSSLLQISFFIFKKTEIVILDTIGSNFEIKKKKIFILDYDKVYFFYLLNTILKYFFTKSELSFTELYKKKIFSALSPKVVIANNISGKGLEFKKLYPESKVIVYQFGYTNKNNLKKIKKKKTKYNPDYFITFHKKDTDMFKNIYKSKFFEFGSVRNNDIKIFKRRNIKKNIVFISEYSPGFVIHNKNQKFILKILSEYARLKKIDFTIALRLTREDKKKSNKIKNINVKDEINFFQKIIGRNFNYHISKNSYEVCNSADLIVSLSSNLGIEMASRKKKVLFLPFNQTARDYEKENIYLKNLSNKLCHIKHDKIVIFNKINHLLKLKNNEWNRIIKKNITLIEFDKNNNKLKKLIKNILNEKK